MQKRDENIYFVWKFWLITDWGRKFEDASWNSACWMSWKNAWHLPQEMRLTSIKRICKNNNTYIETIDCKVIYRISKCKNIIQLDRLELPAATDIFETILGESYAKHPRKLNLKITLWEQECPIFQKTFVGKWLKILKLHVYD